MLPRLWEDRAEWLHTGPKKPKSRNRSLNRRGSKGAGDGDALDKTGSKQGGATARTRPWDFRP